VRSYIFFQAGFIQEADMGAFYRVVPVKAEPDNFFRKHRRWFPFISAAIVLGTFIVHDWLTENAEDLATSIERAQHDFAEDESFSSLSQQIAVLRNRIPPSADEQKMESGGGQPASVSPSRRLSAAWTANEEIDQELYRSTLRVYREIPKSKELDAEAAVLSDVLWDMYTIGIDLGVSGDNSPIPVVDPGTTEREINEKMQQVRQKLEPLDRINKGHEAELTVLHVPEIAGIILYQPNGAFGGVHAGDLLRVPGETRSVLGVFNLKILEAARTARESAESRKRIWRNVSLFLYPFGLAIGLVGKIYGGDDFDPEEEP
jgi:hypothetical protein